MNQTRTHSACFSKHSVSRVKEMNTFQETRWKCSKHVLIQPVFPNIQSVELKRWLPFMKLGGNVVNTSTHSACFSKHSVSRIKEMITFHETRWKCSKHILIQPVFPNIQSVELKRWLPFMKLGGNVVNTYSFSLFFKHSVSRVKEMITFHETRWKCSKHILIQPVFPNIQSVELKRWLPFMKLGGNVVNTYSFSLFFKHSVSRVKEMNTFHETRWKCSKHVLIQPVFPNIQSVELKRWLPFMKLGGNVVNTYSFSLFFQTFSQ